MREYNKVKNKKGLVCQKSGCWSSNRTIDERKKSIDDLKMPLHSHNKHTHESRIKQFTIELEGFPEDLECEEIDEIDTLIMEMNFSDDKEIHHDQGQ